MSNRYAPGRTYVHDKSISDPAHIMAQLRKRKKGAVITWSQGHSKGAARVKAFKANAGKHAAWRGINTDALEFEVWENPDNGTWTIGVKRV